MNKITVHNLSNLPTAPLEAFHELQEDFKIYDSEKNAKLQMLIITRGFKYAFKAWEDETGKLWIIDAHQRKRALQELKKAGFELPELTYELIYAKDKKEAVEEIAAYNSEFGTKNPDSKLFEKYDIGADTLSRFSLGFETQSFDFDQQRMEMKRELGLIVEDEVPEPGDTPLTEKGDLWILGKHRLFCGDSTKSEDVLALMDGRKAGLVTTDPPYNVDYQGASVKKKIKNDSMDDSSFYEFLRKVFFNVFHVMQEGAGIYVFHSDSEGDNFRRSFKEAGLHLSQCCIWVKNSLVMGRHDYQWQHEPVLYGWKPGDSHRWFSDRRQTTIWNFDRPVKSELHPTMKPVKLIAYTIQNSTEEGDIVADFFGGSGTSLIACEQLNRICYMMEFDMTFADVIIRRFHKINPDAKIYRIRNNERTEINNI